MLNFTKNVSCLVIRTAQQIDTKLMHLHESLGDNVLVKSYLIKGFNFLRHDLKQKSLTCISIHSAGNYSGIICVSHIFATIALFQSISARAWFYLRLLQPLFWLKCNNLPNDTKFCSTRKLVVPAKNFSFFDKKIVSLIGKYGGLKASYQAIFVMYA